MRENNGMVSYILLDFEPFMFFGIICRYSSSKVSCVPSLMWKLEVTVMSGSSCFAVLSESSTDIGFLQLLPRTVVGFETGIVLGLVK